MKKLSLFLSLIFMAVGLTAQPLAGKKICIDPGHGGNNAANDRRMEYDPGVVLWESESNFRKALWLQPMLEEQGAWVILTRYTNDYPDDALEPSLTARWQLANANNVDWFHSIHSNAFNGTVNYTLLLVKEDRTTRQAVFPQAVTISNIMGPEIQRHLRNTVRSTYTFLDFTFYGGPGVGYNLGVLNGLVMPGQLSEGSFHDHLPEYRRLMNNNYRKMESYAIRNGFMQYWSAPADPRGIIAGIVRPLSGPDPLNGVKVTLLPSGKVTMVDNFKNGFYMFDSLSAGNYQVVFEVTGYRVDTISVTVPTSGLVFADRNLTPVGPPTILSFSPSANNLNVHPLATISIQFTKPMNRPSVQSAFKLEPAKSGVFTWTTDNSGFTYRPDTLDQEINYTLTIDTSAYSADGFQIDGNGDRIGGDPFILTFRTIKADVWAPFILSMTPQTNQANVPVGSIVHFSMSEPLQTPITSTHIAIQEIGGSIYTSLFDYAEFGGRSGISVFPTTALLAGKQYRVRVGSLRDLTGNQMPTSAIQVYSFTMEPTTPEFVRIQPFDSASHILNWTTPQANPASTGLTANGNFLTLDLNGVKSVTPNPAAMRINYSWDTLASQWLFAVSPATEAEAQYLFGQEQGSVSVQAYIHGDGMNTDFRFVLRDSVGLGLAVGREVSPWIRVSWVGWRLVQWNVTNEASGTWTGDGIIQGSFVVDGIQLRRVPGVSGASGRIVVDELRAAKRLLVSVETEKQSVPITHGLGQNYPNPFNPSTTIPFMLEGASQVKLAIYDMLGREVRTLVNEMLPGGTHSITWDATDNSGGQVASGIYFYTLATTRGELTRKMLLMK